MDGQHIRTRRERLGVSQEQLAAEAGVSRATVQAIERGDRRRHYRQPAVEAALERLAERLGAPAGGQSPAYGPDVETAIRADPHLSDLAKRVLLENYRLWLREMEPPPANTEDSGTDANRSERKAAP